MGFCGRYFRAGRPACRGFCTWEKIERLQSSAQYENDFREETVTKLLWALILYTSWSLNRLKTWTENCSTFSPGALTPRCPKLGSDPEGKGNGNWKKQQQQQQKKENAWAERVDRRCEKEGEEQIKHLAVINRNE